MVEQYVRIKLIAHKIHEKTNEALQTETMSEQFNAFYLLIGKTVNLSLSCVISLELD